MYFVVFKRRKLKCWRYKTLSWLDTTTLILNYYFFPIIIQFIIMGKINYSHFFIKRSQSIWSGALTLMKHSAVKINWEFALTFAWWFLHISQSHHTLELKPRVCRWAVQCWAVSLSPPSVPPHSGQPCPPDAWRDAWRRCEGRRGSFGVVCLQGGVSGVKLNECMSSGVWHHSLNYEVWTWSCCCWHKK